MAKVYRAKDLNLGREVALKVLLDSVAQDPEFRERFRREARVGCDLVVPRAPRMQAAARGADPGVFKDEHKSRSVSNEETFLTDTDDPEEIHTCLSRLCEKVFFRALEQNVKSRTVFLKIRYDDFTTVSARETFASCIPHSAALLQCAEALFNRRAEPGRKLRLIGVGLQIEPSGSVQQELFRETDRDEKQQKTDRAVLDLKKRGLSLTKASSLSERKLN